MPNLAPNQSIMAGRETFLHQMKKTLYSICDADFKETLPKVGTTSLHYIQYSSSYWHDNVKHCSRTCTRIEWRVDFSLRIHSPLKQLEPFFETCTARSGWKRNPNFPFTQLVLRNSCGDSKEPIIIKAFFLQLMTHFGVKQFARNQSILRGFIRNYINR